MGCSDRTAGDGSDSSSGDTSISDDTSGSDEDTSISGSDEDTSDTSTTGAGECGDGVLQQDEECDDGNTNEIDMCSSLCTVPEPVLELSFSQIKQFDFSWPAMLGAEYYQLLESVDVGAPFVQLGGDIVGESISITMPLHRRAHASYKLRACNAEGCLESASVDVVSNLAEAVGYFKASNTDEDDRFANSVALSDDGNTLAVGATGEDGNAMGIDGDPTDDSLQNAGAVYVFVRNGAVWSQQAYVKASNPGEADFFGSSVALSDDGNTLAIGANGEDSSATGIDGDQTDDSLQSAGAVYVFVRNGAAWSQQAYVKASNTSEHDAFGRVVALSHDGNTLAVSAVEEDSNATGIDGDQADDSLTNSGAAYVFVRNGDGWSQQAYIKASNTGEGDRFGDAVSLSGDGNSLAIGSWREGSNATGIDGDQTNDLFTYCGAVYVFIRDGGAWSQQAYVKASNAGFQDQFGFDVALSSDGNTLAVGAPVQNLGAGAAYVFARNGGVWSEQVFVKPSNIDDVDHFGTSVALSSDGDTLAVGAVDEESSATGIDGDQADDSLAGPGAVYVFVRNGGDWSQRAYVKASNTGALDLFGAGVALSNDGDTLAVSTRDEKSSATGIGGDQTDDSAHGAGAVYLY